MKRLLNYIEAAAEKFFRRTVTSTEQDTLKLAQLRVVLGLSAIALSMRPFTWIAEAPRALFDPPLLSIANLVGAFPPAWSFYALQGVLIILLVCFTVGFHARKAALGAFLISVFTTSFYYSFGKIDHMFMGTLAFACLAFTNCSTVLAIRPDKTLPRKIQDYSLAIFAIALAFGFITAGIPKASAWLDLDLSTSGARGWALGASLLAEKDSFLVHSLKNFPPLLTEIIDYSVVTIELSGLVFLLIGRRAFRLWLWVLCIFHLMNLLFLNIPFTQHTQAYAIFLITPLFNAQVPARVLRNVISKWWLIGLYGIIHLLLLIFWDLYRLPYGPRALYGDLLLWLLLIGFGAASLRKEVE